jgi:hypothetical protein
MSITTGNSSFNLGRCCADTGRIVEYDSIADVDAQHIEIISSMVASQMGILTRTIIAAKGIRGEHE